MIKFWREKELPRESFEIESTEYKIATTALEPIKERSNTLGTPESFIMMKIRERGNKACSSN